MFRSSVVRKLGLAAVVGLILVVLGNDFVIGLHPPVVHEDAKLTASDAEADDRLGLSVALSGDTAVVGAVITDPFVSDTG